jgi:hypothetical protein
VIDANVTLKPILHQIKAIGKALSVIVSVVKRRRCQQQRRCQPPFCILWQIPVHQTTTSTSFLYISVYYGGYRYNDDANNNDDANLLSVYYGRYRFIKQRRQPPFCIFLYTMADTDTFDFS